MKTFNGDYKELLKKYIRHVGYWEGVDFIGTQYYDENTGYFSLEEWNALNDVADAAYDNIKESDA